MKNANKHYFNVKFSYTVTEEWPVLAETTDEATAHVRSQAPIEVGGGDLDPDQVSEITIISASLANEAKPHR